MGEHRGDAWMLDARPTPGTCWQHVDVHVIERVLCRAQVTKTQMYANPTDRQGLSR